jgi:uncharacterized glyoxalase superfamily protein PhnB
MGTPGKPIPEGKHTIAPYIIVDGAADAIEFYKKAFGAKEAHRMPGPDGKSIMHAEIQIGDSAIYLTDSNPEWGAKSPKTLGGNPISLHLYVTDADAVFDQAIKAGAEEKAPMMDTFWGDRYGKIVDPYGHEWGIATHKIDMTEAEMMKGAEEWFAQFQANK